MNFVTTGKLNFKDLGNTIVQTLLRIELQVLESKILSSLLWSMGGYGAAADAAAGSVIDSIIGPSTHAKGGVFNSPSLSAYSNGVYDSPQFFVTHAKGNIFAEAGPEAVMPLTRGPDGKLGVKAQGSGGDVIVNVQNNGGQPAQVSQSKDGNGNDIITVMINAAANEVDSRIMRGGSTYKAIQQTYGLSRRGVPVAG